MKKPAKKKINGLEDELDALYESRDLIAAERNRLKLQLEALTHTNVTWCTREGAELSIAAMSDDHISNSIRMLVRAGNAGSAMRGLIVEACRRKMNL